MIETLNVESGDVLEISNSFIYDVPNTKVVITLNTENVDGQLILSDNTMSEHQFVIAKGPMVNFVLPGDEILLDLDKMMVKELNPENSHETISKIKIDPLMFEGRMYGIIDDRLIKAKKK